MPLSYAAFARAIEASRRFLAEQDLPPGRTAIVLLHNLSDAWVAVLALRALGLTTVAVPSLAEAEALGLKDVACLVVAEAEQADHPPQAPDSFTRIFRHSLTSILVTPANLKEMLRRRDLSRPRSQTVEIAVAGGSLPRDMAEEGYRFLSAQCVIHYASTELVSPTMSAALTETLDCHWLSPAPGRVIEIVDDRGIACPVDREGELRVGLTELDCAAYLDDAATSAKVFRDGYFHSGDIAVKRADGRIRILGRTVDVLNVQGQKFAAAPLEQAIQRQLGVDEVCLLTGMSEDGVEELVVALQFDRPPAKPELDAVARDFATFARVRFVVMTAFPRTPTGLRKTLRPALRKLFFPGTGTPS